MADMFDRFVLTVFLMDHYGGQWSRGYRMLCRLLGPNGQIGDGAAREAREHPYYAHLVANYASKV